MIFAFLAYKGQFLDAGLRFADLVADWKTLDTHVDRIADIALEPPEDDPPSRPRTGKPAFTSAARAISKARALETSRWASTASVIWVSTRSTGFSVIRSEEHTSELQSLMRISYAVFCLKKKITTTL